MDGVRLRPPPYDPFLVGRLVESADSAGELLERGALTDADLKMIGRRLRNVAGAFHNDPVPEPLALPPGDPEFQT